MSPAQELALFVILGMLLCAASAAAGALWWRLRSLPLVRAAELARELAERQRALERLIEKLETPKGRRSPRLVPNLRRDRAESSEPTLIAVPDMAAPPSKTAEVSTEMRRRFGPMWELADRGASAEAIAKASGMPIGQVELILGLRHPKGA